MRGIYEGVDENASSRGRRSFSLSKQLIPSQGDTFSYQTGVLGPGVHVVSFGVSQSVGTGQQVGYSANATISFLTNGNSVTRQVSIGSGVSVQGIADAVSVVVQDTSPSGLAPPLAPYGVTVSVGPGTRASDTQPTLVDTASPRTLAIKGGAATTIAIPQAVGIVGVWLTLGSDTTPDVVFGQTDAAAVNRFPFEVKDALPRYVPIVPGCTSLTAANQDAGNTVTVSTLWVIDG